MNPTTFLTLSGSRAATVALRLPSRRQCLYGLFSQTRAPHRSYLHSRPFFPHRKSRFQKQSLAGRTRERRTFYLSLKSKKDSFTPLLSLSLYLSLSLSPPSPPFYANLVS